MYVYWYIRIFSFALCISALLMCGITSTTIMNQIKKTKKSKSVVECETRKFVIYIYPSDSEKILKKFSSHS
ncbi:hypothetical protein Sjap_020692 [Stephania japonica]|uniref:Uncharacterized protein n=1 Tax=Stephania japonica TaxID=461633 RepID=A0AAP0HVT0_9MAGN